MKKLLLLSIIFFGGIQGMEETSEPKLSDDSLASYKKYRHKKHRKHRHKKNTRYDNLDSTTENSLVSSSEEEMQSSSISSQDPYQWTDQVLQIQRLDDKIRSFNDTMLTDCESLKDHESRLEKENKLSNTEKFQLISALRDHNESLQKIRDRCHRPTCDHFDFGYDKCPLCSKKINLDAQIEKNLEKIQKTLDSLK